MWDIYKEMKKLYEQNSHLNKCTEWFHMSIPHLQILDVNQTSLELSLIIRALKKNKKLAEVKFNQLKLMWYFQSFLS